VTRAKDPSLPHPPHTYRSTREASQEPQRIMSATTSQRLADKNSILDLVLMKPENRLIKS
jgi:hypothetical protein